MSVTLSLVHENHGYEAFLFTRNLFWSEYGEWPITVLAVYVNRYTDFPDYKPLPEDECGEQLVTLSAVYVTRHCETSQIIRP